MKKELLLASALASTMGAAGVAEAASATFSGHNRTGVTGTNPDSSDSDTVGAAQLNNFNVSISETTDAGVKIATGFTLTDEGGAESDASGLTLTFTDGSSLQLIEAGSASAAHAVSVPGGGGELGISNTSTNNSAGALTTGASSDRLDLIMQLQQMLLALKVSVRMFQQHLIVMCLKQAALMQLFRLKTLMR